ncbi:unnamed protein product, partial [Brassica oleracea]
VLGLIYSGSQAYTSVYLTALLSSSMRSLLPSGVEPKVVVPANINPKSALSELPLSHCLEDIVGSILTFELKLSPFNFSTKYQSFTISRFFKSHQRPPLPLLENHGGDDMPGGSALKRSPLGLNSRDLNQSGCSGDSIVEGERANTGLNSRALKKTILLFFFNDFPGIYALNFMLK